MMARPFEQSSHSFLNEKATIPSGMARPEGFEPPTVGLEIRCSIQLS